jgi:periodic tryptophan protein 1
VFGKTSGLSYHENGDEQDPYITLDDNVDDDEELREMEIEPTDSMIIACKTEDDVSHLEIYLYEQEEDNLYVHHDIMLPSFPLCAEWMDYKVGKKAGTPGSGINFCIIRMIFMFI